MFGCAHKKTWRVKRKVETCHQKRIRNGRRRQHILVRFDVQHSWDHPENVTFLNLWSFAVWSQKCRTSKRTRMCCLLRPSLICFWWHVSTFLLPSRVSCVRIQTCTTRKLVVGKMQVWNQKYPLLPSLVFLWLAHSDLSCRESPKVLYAPELDFWESWPWWFRPHPSCNFNQEIYPAYLLIARAPVMHSYVPPFLLLTKRCQTAFRWMDHFRRLRPEFCFEWLVKHSSSWR